MRHVYFVLGAVLVVLGLVSVSVAYIQASAERANLTYDLQYRTRVLADSLEEAVLPPLLGQQNASVQKTLSRVAQNDRIAGIFVYDNTGALIAQSTSTRASVIDTSFIPIVMDSATEMTETVRDSSHSYYLLASPLRDARDTVVGAILVVQNARYIDESVNRVWLENFLRILVSTLLLGSMLLAFVHMFFQRPLRKLLSSLEALRRDEADEVALPPMGVFAPFAQELTRLMVSLRQARHIASEEARLRLEKFDSPWTAQRLQAFMHAYMKDRPIYVVSNREPYVHHATKKGITYSVPAHGMVTAIDALMQACGGVWIAHGSGDADRATADAEGKLRVPPEDPRYTLKRVWLSDEEVKGHYVGFSNETLFPLCLMTHTRPVFRPEDWETYRRVNAKFAEAVLEEIRWVEHPVVLIQDLHFALVPHMIKRARPNAQVALFWHHPWPSAEQFSICPWRKEILAGMLGADLIGFHIQQHCNNFIETVGKELEARIDVERFAVTSGGHTTLVRPFPISIPFTNTTKEPKEPEDTEAFARLGVTTKQVALGVDRLDYTKGIVERLRGIEYFFEHNPAYRKQLTFVQIAAPSREAVAKYRDYGVEVSREVERINQKLQTGTWKPIVFVKRHLSHQELRPLYRAAQVCLVTSLHDGMNLVAKEYVAEHDSSGVLILSAFTGAARELTSAIIINPYSPEEIAGALVQALTMSPSEQYRRIKTLRAIISNYNVYRWAMEFIKTLAQATT